MQELEAKKLLDLPAEIIRAILYELDPADLYICLLTSKLFRDHALNSTHLLLAQISRVPGLGPQNRDGLSATDLLRIFGTRATRHLRHGVQMANVHSWRSEEKTSKERSMILRLPNANSDAWFLDTLAYFRIQDDASVHVYTIDFSEDEYGRAEYKPTLKHIITPYSIHRRYPCRDGLDHTIEVLKIASHPGSFDYWNQPLIAVLYRVTRRDRHGVRHSWRTIIIFALDWDFGPVVLDTLSTEPQLAKPEKVSAMAVSRTGVVVVVSRKHDDLLDHQVSFYWKWEDKETHGAYLHSEAL